MKPYRLDKLNLRIRAIRESGYIKVLEKFIDKLGNK